MADLFFAAIYKAGEKPALFSVLSCFDSQLNKKFHIGAVSVFGNAGFRTLYFVQLANSDC
jgi:hypothetical protein